MSRMNRFWIILLVVGMLGMAAAGCGDPDAIGTGSGDREPIIITTIYPIADITRNIAGDAVSVISLIPAGASPHTFEPTPKQMAEIARASAFIAIGAGLDDWAQSLASAGSPDLVQIRLTDGLKLLPHEPSALQGEGPVHEEDSTAHAHHGYDPHIWLDPVLVREHVVPEITRVLVDLVPDREAELIAGAQAYQEKLDALHAEISRSLEGLDKPRFIAFHSAWRYFAARYELIQAASVEESPGKEPSARWISEVVETARSLDAKAIFAEPQFSNKAAEIIAQEFGAEVLIVDPLGGEGLEGRDSYISLMRSNAAVFRKGLK